MMAIRAARAFTGRTKIAKFEGAYHGTHDWGQISIAPPLDQAKDEAIREFIDRRKASMPDANY